MKQDNPQKSAGGPAEGDDDDFDPHLHREQTHPTNDFETVVHMVKANLGTGILALPEALKYSGMINGAISIVAVAIIVTHCLHILVKSQYVICKKMKVGLLPYPHSMTIACEMGPKSFRILKPIMYGLTVFFMVCYQLGVVTAYILFVSTNIKMVIDHYLTNKIKLVYYMLMFLLPCSLLICVPDLKYLAPFSLVANVIVLITCGIIFYYVCHNLLPYSELKSFGSLFEYPIFFGTAMFSLQCPAVVTAVENNMKNPKSFTSLFGALNVSMVIITIIYMIIAILGYWKYGENIESSITLNFSPEEIPGQVVRSLHSVGILLSIGLQGVVGVLTLWTFVIEEHVQGFKKITQYALEYGIRLTFIVITYICAMFIPLFGSIVSLSGVFCLTMLGIAFPVFMEICVKWPNKLGYFKWILWKNIVLLLLAFMGLCAGCYSNIAEIVFELKNGTSTFQN